MIIWPILDPAALIKTFFGYDFDTIWHKPMQDRGFTNAILIFFKSAVSGQNITYLVELRICVAWVPLVMFAETVTFLPTYF